MLGGSPLGEKLLWAFPIGFSYLLKELGAAGKLHPWPMGHGDSTVVERLEYYLRVHSMSASVVLG